MKYANYRDKIKSGDVLAWTHRASWFSSWYDFKVNFVRLVTMSEYSHVGIAWVFQGRVFVIESVTPFVRIVPLSNLLPAYVLTGKGELTEEQLNKAIELVGVGKYSIPEAMIAFLDKNDIHNDKWECAEFVKYVLDLDCTATPAKVVQKMQEGDSTLVEISL